MIRPPDFKNDKNIESNNGGKYSNRSTSLPRKALDLGGPWIVGRCQGTLLTPLGKGKKEESILALS